MATATERWTVSSQLSLGVDVEVARKEWDVIDAADELEAVFAAGVARRGELHPRWPQLKCTNVVVVEKPGPTVYVIGATYDNSRRAAGRGNETLEERPMRMQWFATLTEQRIETTAGKPKFPLVNSAGEELPDPVIQTTPQLQLVVRRWEQDYDPGLALAMMNRVNDADFSIKTGRRSRTIKRGQAKIIHITPVQEYSVDEELVHVEYFFEFRENGWTTRVMDRGIHKRLADTKSTRFEDKDKIPLSSPIRLDGQGLALDGPYRIAGETGAGTPDGAERLEGEFAVFLEYETLEEVSFSRLGL